MLMQIYVYMVQIKKLTIFWNHLFSFSLHGLITELSDLLAEIYFSFTILLSKSFYTTMKITQTQENIAQSLTFLFMHSCVLK